MRIHIFIISLHMLFAQHLSAADALPSAARKAEAKFKVMQAKALAGAQKDVDKAKQRYLKAMKAEVKTQLKANGIEAAQAVQEMIVEIEASDPLSKAFAESGMPVNTLKPKKGLHIEKAIAKSYRLPDDFNVTKDLQKLLDDGESKFLPAQIWGERLGFTTGGYLLVTYIIDGKTFEKKYAWQQYVKFEEVREEAQESETAGAKK